MHISIPANAGEVTRFAREELERYAAMRHAHGVADRVLLGGFYGREHFPEAYDRLPPEGFLIGRHGGALVIAGADERGDLYGVYEYAQHALGVRWVDPPLGEVIVRPVDSGWPGRLIAEGPAFPYRGGNMHMARTDAQFLYNVDRLPKFRLNHMLIFSPQLRLLERHAPQIRRRGIRVVMGGHSWPDFFYSGGKLDPQALLEAHPDWHALVNGRRVRCEDSLGQFCLSSGDAVRHFIQNLMDMLERYHSNIHVLSLWPNDTGSAFCECPECARRSRSENLVVFVNRVAEAVSAKYPEILIETLAYEDFTAPPEQVMPAANVLITFAAIARDYRLPMYGVERRNIALYRHLKGWTGLSCRPRVAAYEYFRLDGIPKSHVIEFELKTLKELGAVGVMEDTFQDNGMGAENGLGFMLYLETKLLWNLDQSTDALLQALLTDLYGPHAGAVGRLLSRMETLQAARALYDLLWHHWRGRPVHALRETEYRLNFILEEMASVAEAVHALQGGAERVYGGRLERIAQAAEDVVTWMDATRLQVQAHIALLEKGPSALEQAEAYLLRVLEVWSLTPRGGDVRAYEQAYGLPERLVRLLIPLDRKDRVRREEIMAMRAHLCEQVKAQEGCLNCTMPVCPEMVDRTPKRAFQ